MFPDRGQEHSSVSIQTSASRKSKDSDDAGYGGLMVNQVFVPHTLHVGAPTMSLDVNEDFSSPQSHIDPAYKASYAMDEQISHPKHATASVRSMSSTENSRRDSAISASSQHRRRPKTSRTTSKQSLRSTGEGLSKTASNSSRQRPRPHRLNTAGTYNTPQTNIEEALALHARSCEIFAAASRPATSYTGPPSSSSSSRHYPSIHRSPSFQDPSPLPHYPEFQPTAYFSQTETIAHEAVAEEEKLDDFIPATVMHWTSDDRRREEYAQIDRSNNGVRGLLKKVLPKWATKGQSKFYSEEDVSDAGSVRRIRLDLPHEVPPRKSSWKAPRNFGM